jgi:hypothetical protein
MQPGPWQLAAWESFYSRFRSSRGQFILQRKTFRVHFFPTSRNLANLASGFCGISVLGMTDLNPPPASLPRTPAARGEAFDPEGDLKMCATERITGKNCCRSGRRRKFFRI